jgi:uncharacterized protein (DUF39 family)
MPDNFDELRQLIEEDERKDALTVNRLMKPRDYARARGMYPQKVYAKLREGKINWEKCECGSLCIVVEECDLFFGFKKQEED